MPPFADGDDSMKAYVMTTGAVFGLITLAHVLRVVEEGPRLARDPFFVILTVLAAALWLWAWRVLRLTRS
jgi:dolichyl-phosphate-mannose--protein O-mannosyl transferase